MPATATIRPLGLAWPPAGRLAPRPTPAGPTAPSLEGDRLVLAARPAATSAAAPATAAAVPDPRLPGGRLARVVVSIGTHRAFLYDRAGNLQATYRVRTGKASSPTRPGVKIVVGKDADPASVARRLWPSSGGRAFGTRLLDLSDFDPQTGRTYRGKYGGQELHGTYQRASIGRDFSHGCVGLANEDIEAIFAAVGVGSLVRFDA